MIKSFQLVTILLIALLVSFTYVWSKTKVVNLSTVEDFQGGKYHNTFFNHLNQLTINYEIKKVLDVKEDVIWQINQENGFLLISSSPAGKLSLYDSKNYQLIKTILLEDEITSITFNNGSYYLGASQTGTIYRADSRLQEVKKWVTLDINFIWDLKVYQDHLFVGGGGNKSKIYRVNLKNKKTEEVLETSSHNILKIDFYNDSLYFSTSAPGAFYEYDLENKKLTMLYENRGNEVPDFEFINNKIYLITSGEKDSISFENKNVNNNGFAGQPKNANGNQQNNSLQENFSRQEKQQNNQKPNFTPFQFINQLVEINEQKESISLFTFNNLNLGNIIYNPLKEELFISSFENGNIWSFNLKTKSLEKIFNNNEINLASLVFHQDKALFSTANSSEIYQISFSFPDEGTYISKVFNLKNTVNWGKFYYESSNENKDNIRLEVRTGNSEVPDSFWSPWIESDKKLKLPASQFMQFKIKLFNQKSLPKLTEISFYYNAIDKNLIKVMNFKAIPVHKKNTLNLKDKVRVDNLVNNNPNALNALQGENFVNAFPQQNKKILLNWEIDNPDGDSIMYNLYYQQLGHKDKDWFPLGKDLFDNFFVFDANYFFDGEYIFKLEYNNFLNNGELTGLSGEVISPKITIDNKIPEIIKIEEKKENVIIQVKDNLSIISGAKYSYNRKFFFDIKPQDKVFDSKEETFEITKKNQNLFLMFTDENNNINYKIINLQENEK